MTGSRKSGQIKLQSLKAGLGREKAGFVLTLSKLDDIPTGLTSQGPNFHRLCVRSLCRRAGFATCRILTVGHTRRDAQLALLADAHVCQALLPAADDLAGSQLEVEWLVAVQAAVKFRA